MIARSEVYVLSDTFAEGVAIVQTGERVIEREVSKALIAAYVADREADVTRELFEQAHFSGIEERRFARVKRQDADHLTDDFDRQEHHRAEASRACLVP